MNVEHLLQIAWALWWPWGLMVVYLGWIVYEFLTTDAYVSNQAWDTFRLPAAGWHGRVGEVIRIETLGRTHRMRIESIEYLGAGVIEIRGPGLSVMPRWKKWWGYWYGR